MAEYTCEKCPMMHFSSDFCGFDKHEVDPDAECSLEPPVCGPWCRYYAEGQGIPDSCATLCDGERCGVNPARVARCIREIGGEK